MSAARHPRTIRPKLSAPEQTEMIVGEMLLLHHFPHHEQAEEFRHNIEYARHKLPALHAHAEIIVRKRIAEEGRIQLHPEECRRCCGAGIFCWQGAMRFCGCPAGDLASKTKVLPDPQPARLAVTLKPLTDRQQMTLLRSMFEDEQ